MTANILWADDEIDLLRPHVLFLQGKGYTVDTVNNGLDAVEKSKAKEYDIIFLDENMPGLSGLETLNRIKAVLPHVPVIMITKSEEEHIMEEAIGGKISDYLIKPVNPNQILLSLKKHLEGRRLVSEKSTSSYQQQFRQLAMQLGGRMGTAEWTELYKELVRWDLELTGSQDPGMADILRSQWNEANEQFSRFVADRYPDWLSGKATDAPLQSHQLFKAKVAPLIDEKQPPLFLVLIDNLRLDQWRVLEPVLGEFFRTEDQGLFYAILPTATQYARNALFAGMMPAEIEKRYPGKWINEDEEGSKNAHEAEFLAGQLQRLGKNVKHSYHKILNLNAGKKLAESLDELMGNPLNVIVYNFVDMLSHARTEMEVIRELASDGDSPEIVYVGQSQAGRLYETLTRHFQGWNRRKTFWRGQYSANDPGLTYPRHRVDVAVKLTAPSRALDEEARMIQELRPRDNVIGQPDEPNDHDEPDEREEAPF